MNESDIDEPPPVRAFTILGVTHGGRRFRPSDWSCRLAGGYGKVEGNVIRYHPDIQPVTGDQGPAVRVRTSDRVIAGDLAAFATANDLVVLQQD
jgi:hypothetical protein